LGVKDIADFQNMEDNDRESILSSFSSEQIEEIANATNRYPSINISNTVENGKDIREGEKVTVNIQLERDGEDYTDFVTAPYYPKVQYDFHFRKKESKKGSSLLLFYN